ncbi:hypothetical protein [Phenylobacterium sp.]|uniref:hypothetical protein n=1 Tax=Phenylobacterium sp. TaxID=1871053 RepID=UPI00273136E3|nr:hypothetical protein [Phenylobacterium sp.]MDP1873803.1 hypothetical protein [Phenylobacterium sp.]
MIGRPKPEQLIVAGLMALIIAATLAMLTLVFLAGRRDAAPAIETAQDQAVSAELAGEGANLAAGLAEALHQQSLAQRQVLSALERAAIQAEDADAPLDPARADRLRAHDDQLCGTAPHLDGCGQP